MTTPLRNTANPETAAFWHAVEESALSIERAPEWMKVGIELNEQNFNTFGPSAQAGLKAQTRPIVPSRK